MASGRLEGVIDTHIHLAVDWKDGGKGLRNEWLPSEGPAFQREWSESDLRADIQKGNFGVTAAVFVECFNTPFVDEAKWVLKMCADQQSLVAACVAHIPVPDGAKAVDDFIDALRGPDGAIPTALKGGRVVLLGDPMPPADTCTKPTYIEGLKALHKHGLLWEWCCQPCAIPHLAEVCKQFPNMPFVLDHLGHNAGGDDFDGWAPALATLASCPNVVAKLDAIEQWGVKDPAPYLDHALKVFGWDRCMAASNWMVNVSLGDSYDRTYTLILEACKRADATPEQIEKVFSGNAKRVYSL